MFEETTKLVGLHGHGTHTSIIQQTQTKLQREGSKQANFGLTMLVSLGRIPDERNHQLFVRPTSLPRHARLQRLPVSLHVSLFNRFHSRAIPVCAYNPMPRSVCQYIRELIRNRDINAPINEPLVVRPHAFHSLLHQLHVAPDTEAVPFGLGA